MPKRHWFRAEPGFEDAEDLQLRLIYHCTHRGMPTMAWTSTVLFMRTMMAQCGTIGKEELLKALWCYTAALVDSLERITSDEAVWVGLGPRAKAKEMRRVRTMILTAIKRQAVAMDTIEKNCAFDSENYMDAERMEYGRKLVQACHFPSFTGDEYKRLIDAFAETGPEAFGLADKKDWHRVVALASEIIAYEKLHPSA